MQFNKALGHTILWKTLNTLFNFFINLLLVRLLGANQSGSFFYTVAVLSFITLVAGICLENGITYYASNQAGAAKKILLFLLPVFIIQILISWVTLRLLGMEVIALPALCFIAGNLLVNYCTALLVAKKMFVPANAIVCAVNGVLFGLLLLAALNPSQQFFFAKISPEFCYLLSVLVQGILLGIVYFIFHKKEQSPATTDPGLIKKLFTFSLTVFLANGLYFLVTRVDYYFTEKYCDAQALSNYIQVSKMGQLLLLLPSMMATVVFPYTSGGNSAAMADKTKQLCRILTFLFVFGAAAIAGTGYWLFPWLFGKAFAGMYLPMLLLLPGILFLTVLSVISAYLDGIKKIWPGVWGNLIALAVIALADYVFIPRYGIPAAAIISSVGYFICMLVSVYWFNNLTGSSIKELFVIKRKDLKLSLK